MSETETVNDQTQVVDVDFGMAVERLDAWVDGFIRLLPNIAAAALTFLALYGLARLVSFLISRSAARRKRDNLGQVLGGLMKWVILIFGGLLAATIVVPTLKPGDLIAGLGVSSVAIGFAFKDILQNWLAGLLILLRQPFEVGDQIEIEGYEGTVEQIETRATIIKTYDAQRVVIPNSDIYTNAVLVKTAYTKRRSQYDIGIGYADDLESAKATIKDAIISVEGVEQDKGVETLSWDLAASWVTIRARWWTDSTRADVVQVRSDVISAVKEALDTASIDMPYDTQVHLFHDQTEDSDGDRSSQREGWPAPEGGATVPRWRAIEEQASKKQLEQNPEGEKQ